MRRALRWAGGAGALLLLSGAGLFAFADSDAGGRVIAGAIARGASSSGVVVSIGALEGAFSSSPKLRDITIADADGVWLRIARVEARWSRSALLRGVADIERLDVAQGEIARKPLASPERKTDGASLFDQIRSALAWRPPLAVRLGAFNLDRLALAEAVLGAPAAVALSGSADLGASGAAASVSLDAKRLDAPGSVALRADVAADGARLKATLDASEPAGGLIARLAAVPDLPPVEAHLAGDGPLDGFVAKIDARAGKVADVAGTATIARQGAARRAALDLSARIGALLPASAAGLFENTTKISGAAAFGDDGAIDVEALALDASAFRFDGSGALGRDGRLYGKARLRGLPAQRGAAFTARTLEASADLGGTAARPESALRLLIEDARGAAGRIGHVDLDARLAPGAGAAFDIAAKGAASGLALADPGLAQAVGDGAKLEFRGRADRLDQIDVAAATLAFGGGEIGFSGRAGLDLLDGRARVAAPDLSRFSTLAKTDLKGALTLAATLSGSPRRDQIAAALDGAVAQPALGLAALDGLLGKRLTLSGKAMLADGGVAFDRLALSGEHVSARVDGKATTAAADLVAAIAVPDLRRADDRLRGRAEADLTLRGSLRKLDAAFTIAARDASVIGRAVPSLSLKGEARDIGGAARLDATLAGSLDGKPAQGVLRAAWDGKAAKVETLDLAIDKASVKGALDFDAGMRARGRLTIAAPDLDAFSAFALQKLAGRLEADVTLDNSGGRQSLALQARGQGVRSSEVSIDRLDAQASAQDIFARLALDGRIAADGVRAGGQSISRVRLAATPGANGATALDLAVDANGFAVAGRGALADATPLRIEISQFSASRGGRRLALAGPASATVRDGGADLKGVAIAAGGGRLSLDGFVGETLALDVNARALPLSILTIVDPSLAFDGVADGQAKISGRASAPAGDWRLKLARISAPQLRSAGLPPVEASASGRLGDGRTSIDGDVSIGPRSRLKIAGAIPLGAGALDLALKGALDAALANTMLSANGQTAAGQANVDLRLSGSLKAPDIGGTVDIVNGAFADQLNGVALSNIAGRLAGRGRDLEIAGLTAQTKNGGTIAVAGRIGVDPGSGFPGALLVKSSNALFVDSELASATGDLDLAINGPLARAPRVNGRVTLRAMDVNVPDRLPASLKPLPGTRQIDAKGFAAQMLAIERREQARAARKSPIDAPLDLVISAPNRIFVRGRGLDAEFGGQLKIAGTIQKPIVDGGFDLRRGRMQLLTQRLDITQGKLTFTGGLTPQLDFAAQTSAGGVTANIAVTGPASQPSFVFSSTPTLPQDEVLSRLLFAKATGSLTPVQAVQLALALAQFSGATSGADAFEKMRKALGVDTLDIDAGGADGPTVGVSRYIARGVSVGVRTGAKPEQSAVNVGVDLFKNFRVQSETRVDGKTSVGVGVEWEY